MTNEEAKSFLINISYKFGTMGVEYLSEKDGEKMREAICICMQDAFEQGKHDGFLHAKVDRWIPVSERLPENGKEVLIYINYVPYLATYEDGEWATEDFVIDPEYEPIAWFELPEPYKAESEVSE